MKKNLSREQIVETALELMRNRSDLRSLNLREIARTLGCAHTNLYNYFPSYNDLLWETHATLQNVFIEILSKRLQTATTAEMRLTYFFQAIVEMYVDNKGWFRLAWHEYIEGQRTERDVQAVESANKLLNKYLLEIWQELTGDFADLKQMSRVLHNTHCYIIGEISNYIKGRGLIEDEETLKTYIAHESLNMFRVCLLAK